MAKFDKSTLDIVYRKTDGYCHLCHKKLSRSNYGIHGAKAAWHIEHSNPRAKGGTDHLNNLYPACINCNIEKGTLHTKTIRKPNGVSRAPYSKEKKNRIRQNNKAAGTLIGGGIGLAILGPLGALVGG